MTYKGFNMTTALVYDTRFVNHHTGDSPESPERFNVILSALQSDEQLWASLLKKSPKMAEITDILRCHDKALVQKISQFCTLGGGYLDADTLVSPESYNLALLAAGAAMTAVDEVISGKCNNAFSLARPPGHHATPDKAMGFCLFNNAAIAARYAQQRYDIKNILIIDWDVHHGNGTQDIFYQDPSVYYFSIHQYPFYPETGSAIETGAGAGKGTTLNIPLPAITPATVYREAFTASLQSILIRFKPELIIISAGFDAHREDPLANFKLSDKDFFAMTQEVMSIADKNCSGKIISILEGGYNLDTLGETVHQHLLALNNT
jgi:acetoin utilization deacetylase AcuC-like enzyme